MVEELNLKSNELMVYALIYGANSDTSEPFKSSIKTIARRTSSTAPTVYKALESLQEKQLLLNVKTTKNGLKNSPETGEYVAFKSSLDYKETLQSNYKETLELTIKKLYSNYKETLQSTKENEEKKKQKEKIKENNIYNNQFGQYSACAREEPLPDLPDGKPLKEEIEAYAKEINSPVSAVSFYEYYEARKWRVGEDPVHDWKALFRSWSEKQWAREQKLSVPFPSVSSSVQALDDRADRERYYAALQRKAESEAERMRAKAEEIPGYKDLAQSLRSLEIQAARAKSIESSDADKLCSRLQDLRNKERRLLVANAINPTSLQPQYSCKNCNDTGWLKDGRACDCYKREG